MNFSTDSHIAPVPSPELVEEVLVSRFLRLVLFTTFLSLLTNFLFSENQTKQEKKGRSLEHLPGPKLFLGSRIIGSAFELPSPSNLIPGCLKLAKKYGPCFRLTLFNKDIVMISDANLAKTLLSSGDLGHIGKASVYNFLADIQGLAFSHGKRWLKMRNIVAACFHFSNQGKHVAVYNEHGNKLVEKLMSTQSKNLTEVIRASYAQIILEAFILNGRTVCSNEDSLDYARNFNTYFECLAYRMLRPWLLLDLVWRLHPKSKEYLNARQCMGKFAEKMFLRHVASTRMRRNSAIESEDKSLIGHLLHLNFSPSEIQNEISAMLFAHETNGLALYYLLFLLAANPDHQEKCRLEVDLLFADGDNSQEYVTSTDAAKLKYLERCIQESLRLLSPVFIFGRRLESTLTLKSESVDVTLSPGTDVLILPSVIHHNPEYFPNPESFDPDRWLPESNEKRSPYSFLPYSGGPRVCLGMKSSQMNLKIIAAKILRNFTIVTKDKLEDLSFRYNLTMYPNYELDLKFVPRRSHH